MVHVHGKDLLCLTDSSEEICKDGERSTSLFFGHFLLVFENFFSRGFNGFSSKKNLFLVDTNSSRFHPIVFLGFFFSEKIRFSSLRLIDLEKTNEPAFFMRFISAFSLFILPVWQRVIDRALQI
jgi:hypothetical protein